MTTREQSVTLARIRRGDLCSGCGLCASIVADGKIELQMSDTGYLRPNQTRGLEPQEEWLVAQTCPGLKLARDEGATAAHPIWGPLLELRTGYATNKALRHHASSGGALSAVLVHLLETGAVDCVVQTMTSPISPIENTISESTTADDVFRAAGSRYAPSAPLSQIDHHLERPGRFAFVGKPCDVAALRALAQHDDRVDAKVPIMLSFFCAGIPSLDGTRQILRALNVDLRDVERFQFRGDGWPGSATATLADGRRESMSYAQSWGDILSKHLQFRCKICPDSTGGFADIVCADAWYSDARGYPLFEEQDGRSLIASRTPKGEQVVQEAISAGHVIADGLAVDEIVKMQPYQARRKQLTLSRLCAMALLGRTLPRYRGLRLGTAALAATPWQNLRSFLGMARRIFQGRA